MNSLLRSWSARCQLITIKHIWFAVISTSSPWTSSKQSSTSVIASVRVEVADGHILSRAWDLLMHPQVSVQLNVFLLISNWNLRWISMQWAYISRWHIDFKIVSLLSLYFMMQFHQFGIKFTFRLDLVQTFHWFIITRSWIVFQFTYPILFNFSFCVAPAWLASLVLNVIAFKW